MVANRVAAKDRVIALLDELPESALAEVASFVEYQRYKLTKGRGDTKRPVPVRLGGLLAGSDITEEDISAVRREMWDGIEDRVP